MRFVVSSSALLNNLLAVNKVISSKNTLPILDNFLFAISGSEFVITASDLETTLITKMKLENVEGEGSVAIEAKRLTDILREFPEQPLSFEINTETLGVDILSENGKFSVVGQHGEDFPELPEIDESSLVTVGMSAEALATGIVKTIFATADDELRPVMNGIFIKFEEENTVFVSSDAHKLVRYKRFDIKSKNEASFILPKKPASLLKNILQKETGEIALQFDNKNAIFQFSSYKLICRLTEGTYPNYESVIPQNNPNKLTIHRIDLFNTIKRVAVFSNQASNLVKLLLSGNEITVSAQDIDFSISAYERLNCQFEGEDMEIGFKSSFLQEILNNLYSSEVIIEMSDSSRAALIFPLEKSDENEDELMLIMPMMLNS
jgi:DNA polymerase-3 subunit beta